MYNVFYSSWPPYDPVLYSNPNLNSGSVFGGQVSIKQANESKVSVWLDKKEKENFDVSQIVLPDDLPYDEVPDETIFFKEINPDGILSIANHPFSTVERFGHWYYCRGRDKATGTHLLGKEWRLFNKG